MGGNLSAQRVLGATQQDPGGSNRAPRFAPYGEIYRRKFTAVRRVKREIYAPYLRALFTRLIYAPYLRALFTRLAIRAIRASISPEQDLPAQVPGSANKTRRAYRPLKIRAGRRRDRPGAWLPVRVRPDRMSAGRECRRLGVIRCFSQAEAAWWFYTLQRIQAHPAIRFGIPGSI